MTTYASVFGITQTRRFIVPAIKLRNAKKTRCDKLKVKAITFLQTAENVPSSLIELIGIATINNFWTKIP